MMRRVAFTLLGCFVLTTLFSFPEVNAKDTATAQDGPTIVVDARGKVIGSFAFVGRASLPSSSVLHQIEDTWFLLPFSSKGFASTAATVLYSGDKCTGKAYVAARPDDVAVVPGSAGSAGIANGILYYAGANSVTSTAKLHLKSQRILNPQGQSVCGRIFYLPPFVGEMKTFELSKLGFVIPFTLREYEPTSPGVRSSKEK